MKVNRLRMVIVVTNLFFAGWWRGCSRSEFGMVIVDDKLKQPNDRSPHFRRSLYAALGCAFKVCCGVASSVGCPVVVELEALSTSVAQDLRVGDRVTVRALMVIGLASLF